MTFINQTPVRRNSHLIPAGFALAVSGLLCVLHLQLFGASWPLLWLPVTVIALWPSRVGPVLSALLLVVAGLWVDFVTLGAPGQWPLVFLVIYSVIRPDRRPAPNSVISGLSRVAVALIIAVLVHSLSGRVVYGVWPDVTSVGRGVLVAMLLTPLVILGRAVATRSFSGGDI